ncbi:MAG: sulfite exporter TauE/SafE family protein [Acidimicrobiales bacterium]
MGTMAMVVATHAGAPVALASHPSPWLLAVSGFLGGVAVGLAGMGGGALMTPALVLVFKLDPRVAIASDLVNALAMKPVGGAVHALHGSVNWALVRLLVVAGVPAAFVGAWVLNQLGDSKVDQAHLKTVLGWALVIACASLVTKSTLTARLRRRGRAADNQAPWRLKPLPTLLAGLVGGFMVGMTSVGSGSLVVILLMLLYPRLSSNVQVGTNLVQAVPLVASAALGQALFGHVDLAVAGSLIVGSVPGVFIGARASSRAPDTIVRPILVSLLVASGLALLITSYSGLAWALVISALVGGGLWGAVDATLHVSEDWRAAGLDRTTWVALMGVGAPLGVGFFASIYYVVRVRPRVVAAASPGDVAVSGLPAGGSK